MKKYFSFLRFHDATTAPRRHRVLLALAVLWFCGWLVATAPAQLLVRVLQAAVPALQLDNVEGTFWQGSARQAFVQINGRTLALGRVDWQLQGWSLLWLHPSAHVSAHWGDQMMDAFVRVSPSGAVTLRAARAQFPVELLQVWAPVPARGVIGANLPMLELTRAGLRQLAGRIEWQRAQWQWGDRWLALGDYQMQVRSEQPAAFVADLTGSGDLAGSGTLAVNLAQRSYRIDAKLVASRTLPEQFRDSLVFLSGAKPVGQAAASAAAVESLHLQRQGSW